MKGMIEFSGFRPKHTVERGMASELNRWISRELSPDTSEPANYTVRVTGEGGLPFYYCRVEVVMGACRWLANEAGKSPLSALAKCLKKMRVSSRAIPRVAQTREHAVVA
jgi:hypothetical protein